MNRDKSAFQCALPFFLFAFCPSAWASQSITNGTWVMAQPTQGFPEAAVGYDNLVYAPGLKKFVMWDNFHNITSETNEGMWAYDFAANRWDLWALNGNFHTEDLPESGHEVGMLQFDPSANIFINYCCWSGAQGYDRPEHTWLFDPVGLVGRNMQPSSYPGQAYEGEAAFDTADNVYVLQTANVANGTWLYDFSANHWTHVTPNGTPPTTAGNFSAMAYDSTNNKIYLFGGILGAGSFTNDLYSYDVPSNTWTKLTPGGTLPSPRQWPAMAFDSLHNVFLMFGGQDTTGYLNDTWIYYPTANQWTQLHPALAPSTSGVSSAFQRVAYDADDNVFVMVWNGTGGYAGGASAGYAAQTWFFRYQGTGTNAGTTNPSFAPPAGSLNHNGDAWANEPQLAGNGSTLYAGWIETGRAFETSNSAFPHPFASQWSGSGWTALGSSYLALDSELSGYDEAHAPSMAVVAGTPWVSWYKTNNDGNLLPPTGQSLFAKSWNGTSWVGGQVGPGDTSGAFVVQNRSQLAAVGNTPYLAYLEMNRSFFPWSNGLYVKSWNGSAWVLVGTGPLNKNWGGVGDLADSVSMVGDGTSKAYVAWTEYSQASSFAADSAPQVYVDVWNGSAWTALGGSLNANTSNSAYGASVAYLGGQPYVAWVERSQMGNNQLFVKTWNGSAWSLVGAGALNRNAGGWAFRPSLVADAGSSSLYLGWTEQAALGQTAQTYVLKFNAGAWAALGGSLNMSPSSGSAERASLAVLGGNPVAAWSEVQNGSLRQIYAKQWNGSSWAALTGGTTPPPTTSPCDINHDNVTNIIDVQLDVNVAVGATTCAPADDMNKDGLCNVIDIQRIVNAALGGPCVSP